MRQLLLGLVPAGVLLGHLVGYRMVGHAHGHALPHWHLPFLAVPAVLAALWVTARIVRRSADELADRSAFVWLAVAQSCAFVGLELVERLAVGSLAATAADPVVLAGLLAQVAVAAALLSLVRLAQLIVGRFSQPLAAPPVEIGFGSGTARPLRERGRASSNLVRGPPIALAV